MRKLIMISVMLCVAVTLALGQSGGPQTYTLKATPSTVAWGYTMLPQHQF